MLNNINSRGLSKSKKVIVIIQPGATSDVIEEELEATVKENSKINTLIVHARTNDLTNNINTLRSVKKTCEKTKKISPNTKIVFSSIIFRKDRRDIEKQRNDVSTRLKNFCKQKNIAFIDNSNLKEENLGLKKLHLNRICNSLFAKNFLSYLENNGFSESLRDDTVSEDEPNVYNDCTPDPKQMLKNIRNGSVNKLTFGHLNINSLRNKFDQLTEMVKGFVDIRLIFDSKLDDSFPEGQFIIDSYYAPFRFDRHGNGGGLLLYVREDTPAKVLHSDFPAAEKFYAEIILHKKR